MNKAIEIIFQSTPPVRGATKEARQSDIYTTISIHAPRAGGDVEGIDRRVTRVEISIHAPRAGGDGL